MKKVKVIDLFNVKYDEMTDRINEELIKIQSANNEVLDVKVMGEQLNKCAVFVYYQSK